MDTLDELLPREKCSDPALLPSATWNCWRFLRTGTPGKDVMTLAKRYCSTLGRCMACCRRTLRSFAA